MNASMTMASELELSTSLFTNSTTVVAVRAVAPPGGGRGLDYYVWVYVSPVVFILGLIGNLLSIAVLHGRAFKHTTTAIYLPVIAVADSIVLLSGLLIEWLEWTEIQPVKEASVWSCRIHKVLFYSAGDASIWLIVAFTFDRFIAVCFPLSKRTVCAPRRSFIVSVTIIVLSVAKNVHEFWTRGPQYDVNSQLTRLCGYPKEYFDFHSYIRPWLAFAVITALPFLLILVFNCLIVRSLVLSQRMRAQSAAATGNRNAVASTSGYKQTTLMCLSVSFAFLVCIAPSIVLLIGKPYWTPTRGRSVAYSNAKAINNLFVYVNHSINFVLYCVSGRRFRDELVALLVRMFACCPRCSCPGSTATSDIETATRETMLNGGGGTHAAGGVAGSRPPLAGEAAADKPEAIGDVKPETKNENETFTALEETSWKQQ